MISWRESQLLVKKYGLPVVNNKTVTSRIEAKNFLKKHGNVAIKLYCSKASHKTDNKLVFTGIDNVKELESAFTHLEKQQKKLGGEIVVQEFVDGLFIILGGKQDDSFGPVVMLGLGGIYAEVFKDTTFRLAPLNKTEATRMINELKSHEIFMARGKKYNTKFLTNMLVKLSKLISQEEINAIDINPFILSEKEGWCVDLRIEQ